jgi:LuxR family maltose regulon positive regulatory protein
MTTVRPGLGEAPLATLRSAQAVPPNTIMTHLVAELCEAEAPLALVLDDVQLITAQPVHDSVVFLPAHMPPQLHFLILARADPPRPLGRPRAPGGLVEIRAADLRFTIEEAATFLNRIMGLKLSVEDVATPRRAHRGTDRGAALAGAYSYPAVARIRKVAGPRARPSRASTRP